MGRFSDSNLQKWHEQENSPLANKGMQQSAHAAAGYGSDNPRFKDSSVGKRTFEDGYVSSARSWYSGANTGGTENGWNTDFIKNSFDRMSKAQEKGTLGTYFEQDDATGVVLWDHDSNDGRKRFKFGDIVEDGKVVGNAYKQFDKPTADLMMSDFLFDNKQKSKFFADQSLGDEVEKTRQKNNVEIPKQAEARAFAKKTEARSDDIQDKGWFDTAVSAAGAVGGGLVAGAAAGAVAGSWTGPGALVTGAVGAAVGGTGAYLNRDELADHAARAYEITALRDRESGRAAGISTGIEQWSGFGGKFISPLSNVVHGASDASAGNAGDGESQFYKVDKASGKRVVSKGWRVADIGATVGDSLAQFASPLGLSAYSAQMTGTIAGEVGGLALSGGKSFDDRRGGFDDIFHDDQGNFDLKSGAAGIGKVGIDAVQLGMARGLASKVNAARTSVGLGPRYGQVGLWTKGSEAASARLPKWAGGQSEKAAAAAARAAGGREVELGAYKYTLDAGGTAVSRRATMSILAPSEQLSALSTGAMARRAAAKRPTGAGGEGALSADDFYKSAQALAMGESRWRTTVVNAMGEGYEEAMQAVLEPMSHNADFRLQDVAEAAAYGAAAGAGMGLAFGHHTPNQDDKLFNQANLNHGFITGGAELDRSEWDSLGQAEKNTLAAQTPLQRATTKAAYDKISSDQKAEHVAGVAGVHKVLDAVQSSLQRNLANLTDRTDGSFVITQIETAPKVDADGNLLPGYMPSDGVVSSGKQLKANLINLHRGIAIQLDGANGLRAQLEATDPADTERVAAVTKQIADMERTQTWAQRMDPEIDAHIDRMYSATATEASVAADAESLNDLLRRAFNMQIPTAGGQTLTPEDQVALSRAVSMVFARDPNDSGGSYQMLVPQVSPKLTTSNSDNVLEISHAILSAIRGDFDGDKLRPRFQLYLGDEDFVSARSGAAFLGATNSVNVTAPKYESYVVDLMAQALKSSSKPIQSYALGTMADMTATIRRRYTGLGVDKALDKVFTKFFAQVHAGSPDARAALLDGLAGDELGGVITEYARSHLSNEWMWVDQVVRSHMQQFQETYAAHRPTPDVNTETPQRIRQTTKVKERAAARNATLGETLGNITVGDDMFRKFQKLHYSIINSPVLSANDIVPTTLQEMSMLYEALGSGITQAEVDAIRSKDAITARVLIQLQRLSVDAPKLDDSLSQYENLVVLANMQVQDFELNDQGDVVPGKMISLVQLLLKREVARDRLEKDAVWDSSPELQAKHGRLLSMTTPGGRATETNSSKPVNAERAFVEVMGSQQMFTLLGDESGAFGPHLTVEQYLRYYTSLSELARRDEDRRLKGSAEYLGREGTHNLPYTLDEIVKNKVSAYRSVVDALIGVGHNRITMDKDGNLSGEIADRSERVAENFRTAHKNIRASMQQMLDLSPRKDGELTVDVIRRLIKTNPDFARQLMELIPNATANSVLRIEGSNVFAANWFYEMFAMSDPAEAEMHYWRNLFIAEWRSMGLASRVNEEGDVEHQAREYDRLPRRMHQIFYEIQKNDRTGRRMEQFLSKMQQDGLTLKEFMRWVNTTPGIRGNQRAPLTAWVDDVAEFDADKAQGGWTTALQGAELREAIGVLAESSGRMLKDMQQEKLSIAADAQTLDAIDRVIRKDDGADVTLQPGDREVYAQMEKSIELAGDLAISLGPQAMIYQTVGAVRGFYPQAHNKGVTPDNVSPTGAFDALRDAFGYVTNYERMLASMTAVNLDAVGGNLSQVAKDGVRSMDDEGRTVVQDQPSVKEMVGLLRDPGTRALARGILFPQVMERTQFGTLSPQLLVGKTLGELFDGTTVKQLINVDGKLSMNSTLKYAALVEAGARKYGAHSALQRAVNDLVIARTSAADHVLSTAEIERMAIEGYRDVVLTLQDAGGIAASLTDDNGQPIPIGVDPLESIADASRQARRLLTTSARLGLMKSDQEYADIILDTFVQERKVELLEDINRLTQEMSAATTPAEVRRYQDRIKAAQADHATFVAKVEALLRDDHMRMAVEMFTIRGSATDQAEKKRAIVDYVGTHLTVLQYASSQKLTLAKLTEQMLDTGQPELTDKEWNGLSQAVIALYLDDTVSMSTGAVHVMPFPDNDHVDSQRYFDTSYSYLAAPLLDRNSPLVQAARDIHLRSGRRDSVTTDEILSTLGRTIYKDYSLGPWTSDIPRASVEANQRLDSAAAEPGIAIPGDSPKRQGVMSAATRRTFLEPDEALLSTVTLRGGELSNTLLDDVTVQHPGATAFDFMPMAQLNNRFASAVILHREGLDDIDLLATDRRVGRPFRGNNAVAGSKYREIHMDRVRAAVESITNDLTGATVEIRFFHPDMQPLSTETENWYNNIYFEGTSFRLDADVHRSLNETLWFAYGGLNPEGQAQALDASKLGLSALQVIDVATREQVAEDEASVETSLAGVLRAKTARMLSTDLGFGKIEPEFYNAIYKDLKLRHFVRGEDAEGNATLWTSEQVIDWQMQHPDEDLPLANPELWIPTDDVLRSMLGELGTQGVPRVFEDQIEIDLSQVPTYKGVTPEMLERFRDGIVSSNALQLVDTRVADRARQGTLVVRSELTPAERTAFDQKVRFFAEQQDSIYADRSQDKTLDVNKNLRRALEVGRDAISAENLAFDWSGAGISFFGPRNPRDTGVTKMLLHELNALLEADGYRTGWVFEEGGKANSVEGQLSEVNLGSKRGGGMVVAPGDLVTVLLDSFNDKEKTAKSRLDYLVDHGAIIVLGSGDGRSDLRVELADHLEKNGYERMAGSKHVYQPVTDNIRYQNQRARVAALKEVEGVTLANRLAVFSVEGLPVEENAAWGNIDNENLGSIGVTVNLVPTSAFGGYNVPVEYLGPDEASRKSQVVAVREHLRHMNNPEGLAHLRKLSGDPDGSDLEEAFDRMMARFDEHNGVVLPQRGDQFVKGDMIPLVGPRGQVLLYRHGYKAPSIHKVNDMLAETLPNKQDGANVAIYGNKPEKAATIHEGEVVEFKPRSGYGLSVEMNIPFQLFGNKFQLEMNGMKYVVTPKPDDITLPDHSFFANGKGIDLVASAADMKSKQSFLDQVDNHRNAFAFFGIDFLPDVTEFFFPGQRNDVAAQRKTRDMLHAVATRAPRITDQAADEILNSTYLSQAFTNPLMSFSTEQQQALQIDPEWLNRLDDQTSVEARITSAMLVYLSTRGARVQDVLSSGGFNNDDSTSPDQQSIKLAPMFTQVFDRAPFGSALRKEINRRLNAQLHNPNGPDTGYVLGEDFIFHTIMPNNGKNMRGHLQFAVTHSSGDNPVKNGMAFDETEKTSVSYHSNAIASQAIGAQSMHSYDLAMVRNFAESFIDNEKDLVDGGLWRMLTDIPAKDNSFRAWRAETPAESARKGLAREAVVEFRQLISTADDAHWSDTQRAEWIQAKQNIVRALKLKDNQTDLVDGWTRQFLGEADRISGRQALAAANEILWNVSNHYMPTTSGMVPLMHVHDLQLIYRANEHRPRGWKPRESMDPSSDPADKWDAWTEVALGSALLTNELFDPLYLLATDGFMHTYQAATDRLLDLPVSLDALTAKGLLDEDTNQMLVSIEPSTNRRSTDPVLLNVERATIDSLMGGQRIAGKFQNAHPPASEVAKRIEKIRAWRKETGIPMPVDTTMRNFRKNGGEFADAGTTTNSLARMLINLRVGTALINPALWVSMGPEAWVRGSLDRAANLLTGQATSGALARFEAKHGLSQYSSDQMAKLNQLYTVLGARNEFKAMIYRDLMFKRPHALGHGRIEKWLEGYARLGSHMQDPTWGMPGGTMARRYLEAALQHINATPTLNVLTTDQVIDEMMTNPKFLEDHYPEAHKVALASIAQLRSLKPTPLSLALRGIYEPMSTSTNSAINLFGNVVLKMPLLFSGYAMNVVTTITGLQGLSDMTAMFMEARPKNTFIGRIQAKLRDPQAAFTPEDDAAYDMSSVIEGIDLSRSFIRGGLTHTGLMAFGLMAGGLGLSGEDEEMKRRRRAAEAQGAVFMYDPRKVTNDFRNADALYLDWMPFGLGQLLGGPNEMGQPHWMLKQFVSPMMGIEKFLETGDFRHVTWGFQDAIGAFPIINTLMWGDAVETAHELADAANEVAKGGKPADLIAAHGFLTTAVGTYERMLFENSFVNMIYASADKYDRDPYKQPLFNEDGTQRTDALGRPESSTVLQKFMNDKNKVQDGYVSRDDTDAALHAYTENRFTAAFGLSIFSGLTGGEFSSDYWRRNQPIKERTIEKVALSEDEAQAMILAAFQGRLLNKKQSMPNIDETEALARIRNGLTGQDKYLRNVVLEPYAAQDSAASGMALIKQTKEGREALTTEGARAIYRGLLQGTVKLGDASLTGLHIPYEMREKIQKDWQKELVQEGINLGLDKTKSLQRMKRLWYGPTADPGIKGIGEILWDKGEESISWSDKIVYNQLNTTYVTGPDGLPWATSFQRGGFFGALGLKPINAPRLAADGATTNDERLNTVDLVNGVNTGLRALELKPDAHIPTDAEIGKSIEDAIKEAAKADYEPFKPFASSGGGSGYRGYGGYGGYGGSGWRNFGGGGGYSSGGYSNFEKMYALPESRAPYGDSIPFINTTNPLLRRESVRRERVWSEKGKLKQWQ